MAALKKGTLAEDGERERKREREMDDADFYLVSMIAFQSTRIEPRMSLDEEQGHLIVSIGREAVVEKKSS